MRSRPYALLCGALAAVLLSGCAQSVDPIERLGKKAAHEVSKARSHGPTLATYRRWGLSVPLVPAPKPSARVTARTAGPGLAPVVDRVPTRDKVVFLTYDDGAERDPRFVDLVRELRLPVSMFVTDSVVGPGYGHFARLRAVGATVQNHTLDHPSLRGLPYAGQRAEICGQQNKLKERFGIRPRFLRPPYGTYDTTTLRVAADCGIAAVVRGRDADAGPLRPGDILSGSEHPNLTEATVELLRRIQAEGFTPARLEDYL
ncbi:polysaccharide deacetylase family protein [Streptomyces sp. NBC_00564]|uniref:polysaccharide deacetylase family protein n=1 Tax=Streptomyces sp. NBC_00564 TaxID=2903663 RepID=UPI00352EF348|nr:polysaccharide deacetylase family protein [Streptomyces sp. NBC_00564]